MRHVSPKCYHQFRRVIILTIHQRENFRSLTKFALMTKCTWPTLSVWSLLPVRTRPPSESSTVIGCWWALVVFNRMQRRSSSIHSRDIMLSQSTIDPVLPLRTWAETQPNRWALTTPVLEPDANKSQVSSIGYIYFPYKAFAMLNNSTVMLYIYFRYKRKVYYIAGARILSDIILLSYLNTKK
jgi:hypothetical protein